jgi:hypothetical protein
LPLSGLPLLDERLPSLVVPGDRFTLIGLICGILGLLASLVSPFQLLGWISGAAGVLFASIGFVKYCHGKASNREEAIIGGFLAWLALVILLTRASVSLQIPLAP